MDEFSLAAGEQQVFITAKASRIHVPKHAFRRPDGKPIRGKVRVTFREYQTAGEILASGLPMTYTTPAGKHWNFESAGMFEIRAIEGNDPLELDKGKEIKVELATPSDGAYNFYTLGDNSRQWTETATNLRPVPNPYLAESTGQLAQLEADVKNKPKAPLKRVAGKVFDIKADPGIPNSMRSMA